MVCSFYSVELNWVAHRLPWLRPFLSWTIRTADSVTAISNSTADAVKQLVERPVSVIPYGAAFSSTPREPGKEAFSGDGSPLRLLFVGRLVERKGVEVLVRALARLRHRIEAELVIVGSGERAGSIGRTAALEGVAEHVHMRGFLSSAELAREYAECDIFVLPAIIDARGDTEGLGVVLLEAMAYERPVVASGVGGIVDIVRDGVTGWLVDPGDSEVLAQRLLEVASDPEAARQVAVRGRQDAATRFSWERILAETTEAYERAREARRESGR
jgi:glycosyltransferase involved in cell wall biosynthesis